MSNFCVFRGFAIVQTTRDNIDAIANPLNTQKLVKTSIGKVSIPKLGLSFWKCFRPYLTLINVPINCFKKSVAVFEGTMFSGEFPYLLSR